jgi:N-acylneuraminate cytidylyltransferase
MNKNNELLAIIPARGGSKGIPRKNIRPIAGKPLIAWTIEQALASEKITRVVVSTDDEEIRDCAQAYGADVPFLRPDKLANDSATTESAMLHCLDWLEKNEGYTASDVVLLQATSPIRVAGELDRAITEYKSKGYDSILSVCEFWHFLWNQTEPPSASYNFRSRPRRQDILQENKKYKENGSIYISNTLKFNNEKNRICGSRIGYHLMKEEHSYEIDTLADWVVVEALLEHLEIK